MSVQEDVIRFKKRNISLPPDIYRKIEQQAKREGRTFSNMVARLCELQIKQKV